MPNPPNKKAPGAAAAHAKYYYTQYSAKKRKIEWALSEEEFMALSQRNCEYCGAEPKANYTHPNYNGAFLHNGIDRIENEKGYTITNSIPCCADCNYAKNDRSPMDFIQWVIRIYNNKNLKVLNVPQA